VNYYAIPEGAGARHTAASRSGSTSLRIPFALVFAALTFNFFLCFVHTNFFAVSRAHVIAAEMLIIGLAFLASYKAIGQNQLVMICAAVFYLLLVSMFRSLNSSVEFDGKVIRDFMIPIAFFLLGTTSGNLTKVDSLMRITAVIVTAVAVFEYFFLDTYLRFFNIIDYYVARGSVDREEIDWLSVNLYVSGIRPEGRTLFPFLGDHRVSTIFLEPVSPGNFSVTLFFWALVRSYFERRLYLGLFAMAIFLAIMADNRFGVILFGASLVALLIPTRYLQTAVFVAPFVVIVALLGVGLLHSDPDIDNSFGGRILSAGETLAKLDVSNWIGIGEMSDFVDTYADSGYAYTISRIGILGFVAFWGIFMALRSASAQFHMFRAFCALYFAAILCVSYSPYTIKTAGLLWFLLGALSVARRAAKAPALSADGPRPGVRQDFETMSSR
jgi:putative polymerase